MKLCCSFVVMVDQCGQTEDSNTYPGFRSHGPIDIYHPRAFHLGMARRLTLASSSPKRKTMNLNNFCPLAFAFVHHMTFVVDMGFGLFCMIEDRILLVLCWSMCHAISVPTPHNTHPRHKKVQEGAGPYVNTNNEVGEGIIWS